MIAQLAAALLLPATPQAVSSEIREKTEICREGLRRWDQGDQTWMEREMARLRYSEARKQGTRTICLVYLQGVVDVVESLPPELREDPAQRVPRL